MDEQDKQFDKAKLKFYGKDVYISENVEIKRPHLFSVGNHVAIDSYFYCTTQVKLGNYIHITPFVSVIGGKKGEFIMEDFTTVAAGCRIICGSEEYLGEGLVGPTVPEKYHDKLNIKPVIIEKFASLGTNVVVMPGVTIAEGSVVGANSLVTKSTEPWGIYYGSPAKFVKPRQKEKMIKMAEELGYKYGK